MLLTSESLKAFQEHRDYVTSGLCSLFQVGLATCQVAREHGLKVLGTAGSEEGKKLVLQNGAHEVFDHKEVNYIDKIKVKFSTVLHKSNIVS